MMMSSDFSRKDGETEGFRTTRDNRPVQNRHVLTSAGEQVYYSFTQERIMEMPGSAPAVSLRDTFDLSACTGRLQRPLAAFSTHGLEGKATTLKGDVEPIPSTGECDIFGEHVAGSATQGDVARAVPDRKLVVSGALPWSAPELRFHMRSNQCHRGQVRGDSTHRQGSTCGVALLQSSSGGADDG